MNERFKELPEEKQRSIFNAAMEVFGKYEYKRASTDLIASKAGVSKGLLFYYFHNKKELYFAVHEYFMQIIKEEVADSKMLEITDFFALITYVTRKKIQVLAKNPYIMEFGIRCHYSKKEDITDELRITNIQQLDWNYSTYFSKLDFSKFKENVDPKNIFNMLVWMVDGYINEQQLFEKLEYWDEFEKIFASWIEMFQCIAYKEEYL